VERGGNAIQVSAGEQCRGRRQEIVVRSGGWSTEEDLAREGGMRGQKGVQRCHERWRECIGMHLVGARAVLALELEHNLLGRLDLRKRG
jgi:hypothetical protein